MNKKDSILNTISIQPGTNIVDVFSGSGYTLNTAIADIVDNSLTAKAKNIDIDFHFEGIDSWITISDDGFGMNQKTLEDALIYGKRSVKEVRNLSDTGRFSVGLKTAASRFANRLIVCSKGSKGNINTYLIDFKHLAESGNWEAYRIENRKDLKIKSSTGTIIVLEGLKIEQDKKTNKVVLTNEDSFLEYIEKLEKHLSKTYYYFIESGVKFRINGNKVKGWSPFDLGSNKTNAFVNCVYDEKIKVNGSIVSIVGYVLPPNDSLDPDQAAYIKGSDRSLITSQGFYFYRGKRLISSGGWLGLDGLEADMKYNYARIGIFVDNTLDDYLSVNFMKNTINPPQEFAQTLISVAKFVRSASVKNFNIKNESRPYEKKKHKLISPWVVKQTENGMQLRINRKHPTIDLILEDLDKRKKEMLLNLLEKNIPVGEIQNFNRIDADFTDEEILDMLNDLYNTYYAKNYNFEEIRKIIVKTEPFLNEKYMNITFEFLDRKENNGK